jgi:transposase
VQGEPTAEQFAALTEAVARLTAAHEKVAAEREEYRRLYLQMLERCRKLELGLLGQKAERLSSNDAQLTMSLLGTLLGDRDAETELAFDDTDAEHDGADDLQPVAAHARRKPGRKPLPEHLPRVEIEVLPPEVEAEGRDAFEQIGVEVAEVLERRPASVVIVRVLRPKLVRRDRERNAETKVFTAAPPDLPIERGLAGPGMLADTIVRRWQDHLPANRLESIYARDGLDIGSSTLCGWHAQLGALAKPLVDAMLTDAFASPLLCVDATGVLVQAKEQCRRAHFWVVVAPQIHVIFRYSARHDSEAVDRILSGYQGYLVVDAHAVYDHLFTDGKVIEAACWAHCRRYYFKALGSDPERARQALAFIKALFEIERKIAGEPRKRRESIRAQKSKPIVDAFFAWCDAEAQLVLDDTPISKAIGYSRNQRVALQRFLVDGRLPIHNNSSELQLRREAVGRKNWLFVGHDDAAEVNCTFVSLLASCQLHGIEPWAYLRDLLCLLPRWPAKRILELAPAYWKQTLEQQDTRQRLDADIFRRVTLGPRKDHPSEA